MSIKGNVDQRGMVSLTITLVMMLVISLIVVGFAQVSNRNRREALDRQLSMQAFYAAESGVNSAASKIRTALATGTTIATQTVCTGTDYYDATAAKLVSDGSVAYTCVLVNPTVDSISTTANTQGSTVVPIDTVDSSGVSQTATSLKFSWSPPDGVTASTSNCQATSTFPVSAGYICPFGLLRVDLFKVDGASITSASNLAGSTATLYLKPTNPSGGGTQGIGAFNTSKAYIVNASYASGMYSATINFTAAAAQSAHYYARITTLYKDAAHVYIDGVNSAGNSYFANAQATVDVTGRAQDVLRRVQVRVPLQQYGSQIPGAAVRSGADVCKRFAIYPGNYFPDALGCGP